MQSRSKQAKGIFHDLATLGCLLAVQEKRLTDDQRGQVFQILKKRNHKISESVLKLAMFFAQVEPKCSPEYLVAGDATVCCMRFGASNANTYAKEEGFGILNIYYKNRIVANSVLWIEDYFNCLVLDNIEVHPNYVEHNPTLERIFLLAAKELMEQYELDFAVQGQSYSDLTLPPVYDLTLRMNLSEARNVVLEHFYSDANRSKVVGIRAVSLSHIEGLARKKETEMAVKTA